jgi:prepilin peptidase CpaA
MDPRRLTPAGVPVLCHMLWVPLILLVAATVFDLWRREIPNWIPLTLIAWAIIAAVRSWSAQGWVPPVAGFVLALAIGMLLFWRGGFGGGDVKLLAGLGAVVGPVPLFSLLFYVALAGGVLAVVAALRGKKELAYAPAITLGFVAFMISRGAS